MQDFKPLIQLITETIDKFNASIPGIQEKVLDKLRTELRSLDLKGDNIAISTANVRKIAAIKAKLKGLILTPEYKKQVKEFVRAYDKITTLQNRYFEAVVEEFKPPAVAKDIRKQAIETVVDDLTERGINANVI